MDQKIIHNRAEIAFTRFGIILFKSELPVVTARMEKFINDISPEKLKLLKHEVNHVFENSRVLKELVGTATTKFYTSDYYQKLKFLEDLHEQHLSQILLDPQFKELNTEVLNEFPNYGFITSKPQLIEQFVKHPSFPECDSQTIENLCFCRHFY